MMDGYLRLSQRKNAGTPMTSGQLKTAAGPAESITNETGGSGSCGHRHFLPRAFSDRKLRHSSTAGEAGKGAWLSES